MDPNLKITTLNMILVSPILMIVLLNTNRKPTLNVKPTKFVIPC